MTKHPKDKQTKETRFNQNIMIAILGAATTIFAAIIPWALNRYEAQSRPTPAPIIITATSASSDITQTTALPATVESTPTVPSPTPTADVQTGIFDAFLAYDQKGDFRSTSFSPTQEIYLFFNLNDPLERNIVKAVWIAVDVAGYNPNIIIDKTENKITTPTFSLRTNREVWELGKYKVELYLNGTLDETIEFEIAN
jgi:hypothetical protein